MRIRIVRQSIAPDHRQLMRHDPAHIRLVHLKENRPRGQQLRCRLPRRHPPLRRDILQHRPAISGCGTDQVICTGTSGRSRSGISTVDPAAYGYTSNATFCSRTAASIRGKVSAERP
jgi:hypothetical protein